MCRLRLPAGCSVAGLDETGAIGKNTKLGVKDNG